MKLFGFRFLLAVAFVGGLGLLASSPAMAYCRECRLNMCADVGAGQSGCTLCVDSGGQCHTSYCPCSGAPMCDESLPGSCIDENGMFAPEATIVLAAGARQTEPFGVVDLARLSPVAAERGTCLALASPAGWNRAVIR